MGLRRVGTEEGTRELTRTRILVYLVRAVHELVAAVLLQTNTQETVTVLARTGLPRSPNQ